jgi:hypothetical protein
VASCYLKSDLVSGLTGRLLNPACRGPVLPQGRVIFDASLPEALRG